ncbi:MAG: SpoIIE family protein phosphatase [Ruminococcus sp.]|nr:SpoIIE family protein phosphatase [Ruminococcus sp.]
MKEIFGLKIGGLQQKLFNLGTVLVLLIIGVYVCAAVYQSKSLSKVTGKANSELQTSIEGISSETMDAVVESALLKDVALQAYIADDIFCDIKSDVLQLQDYAAKIFENPENYNTAEIFGPEKENDGKPAFFVQSSEIKNISDSEYYKSAGNMKNIMLSMFENSDKLSSCFIGTADGLFFTADDKSAQYFDENGKVSSFDVLNRPWYVNTVETNGLCFTGVERDFFTGRIEIVCSAPVYKNGKIVAVVGANMFLDEMEQYVNSSANNGGFVCVINGDGKIIFSPHTEGTFRAEVEDEAPDLRNSENRELAAFVAESLEKSTPLYTMEADGTKYYMAGSPLPTVGWSIISLVDFNFTRQPTEALLAQYDRIVNKTNSEAMQGASNSLRTVLILTVVMLALASFSSLQLAKRIVNPIERMTKRIADIKDNDLQFVMEDTYRTDDEVEELAKAFATLSERTCRYINDIQTITAEKEKISAELNVAAQIQEDMLPKISPVFPGRKEFDIYASMNPAKEVGGDFYDFFMIDDDHFGMVMADVSGKGVPAALFMVIAKTLIKNRAQTGGSPSEILRDVNNKLCEGNDSELFVTVWLSILEISTGKVVTSNAGHEYPMLKRKNEKFELVKTKHSPAVATLEGLKFREYEFQLHAGDILFVYTDGAPEATNTKNELFGTERMIDVLNKSSNLPIMDMIKNVSEAINLFVGDAPQFDDITMLGISYYGEEKNHE